MRPWVLVAGWMGLVAGLSSKVGLGQQPRPTIRFVIPQIEQTKAARATAAVLPSPTPDMSQYWWNQPDLIEAFGLDEQQRKEMDAAMVETQRAVTESIRRQNRARDRFEEAVRKRDWEEARQATAEWEQAFALQWGVANRSKIDILQKLRPEQHEKMVRDYEFLLHRPWTVGQRMQVRVGTPSPVPVSPTPGKTPVR